jgi:hypothetical protein
MTTNLITITCTAPDDKTASHILTQAQKYFNEDSAEIPWLAYGQSDFDDLQWDYKIYLNRKAAERQWDTDNQDYIINITHRSEVTFQRGNTRGGHAVLKEWHDKKASDLSHVKALPDAREREILRLIDLAAAKLSPTSRIERNGLRVIFRRIALSNRTAALPAIVAWLEGYGCKDVKFS